uniref:L1 transposable element RRM domain-containing protein n=1 Tax=Rousettus aegyptiacus TaxID=9407 RepID=A0A7J8D687_ROUAE|nr:hypothetical protein HJG63_008735 [Rousettus aegyptiacus]
MNKEKDQMPYLKDGKSKDTQLEITCQDYKNNVRRIWDTIKDPNIQLISIPEENQDVEQLSEEIMMENFPNLVKEMDIKPQEAQRIPKIRDPKRSTPRHIIIKMPKVKNKERILKAARVKQIVTYKGITIRLAADFSKETMQDGKA